MKKHKQQKLLKLLQEQKEQYLQKYKQLRTEILSQTYRAKSKFCYHISAGHGAIDPNTGLYTTGNAKRYTHDKSIGRKLHREYEFLEGVSNRIIAELVVKGLKHNGIIYKRAFHEYKDTPLSEKVKAINTAHYTEQKAVAIDIHSNAARGTARGVSIWTSIGQTKSDLMASASWDIINRNINPYRSRGARMMRQTYKDKDNDYERNFTFVHKTACEAVLYEFFFFDNPKDVLLLMDENVQQMLADSIVQTILWREAQNY